MLNTQVSTKNMQDENLSTALQNYLSIIIKNELKQGFCRASEIASEAKVTRSSVTSALRTLMRMGYIEYAPYKPILLTEKGMNVAKKLMHRKIVLEFFFATVLQIPEDAAKSLACTMEHIIDGATLLRIQQFSLYVKHCNPEILDWHNDYQLNKDQLLSKTHDLKMLVRFKSTGKK